MSARSTNILLAKFSILAALASCSGGGSTTAPSQSTDDFQLSSVSVSAGAVLEINRAIEFTFSEPVDFLTVTSNTINIVRSDGVPATGSFTLKPVDADGDGIFESTDDTTVVYRPACPLLPDLSDAGFSPGGASYTITVVGGSPQINGVRSSDGSSLTQTTIRPFSTPRSANAALLFHDTTPGGPAPVVRPLGASTTTAGVSYVQVGGNDDPTRRIYFEFDAVTQTYHTAPESAAPTHMPLNLYSTPESFVSVVLVFNQSVSPMATNISEQRVRLEVQTAGGPWTPIDTRVELISNCTQAGASLRLQPSGILPADSLVRAVVLDGFRDIRGDATTTRRDRFGLLRTQPILHASLPNPTDGADEALESFDLGGAGASSLEDTTAVFATPTAVWKDGVLAASFDFQGSGGPGGDFDWIIRSGQRFLFDTGFSEVVGGPNGVPVTTQRVFGGIVDVRNLIIEEGAVLRVQGPNPLQINATGFVRIDGTLDASGFNAKNVAGFSSGAQPEVGGAGSTGGGLGGSASERTTSSTPYGGTGGGPLGEQFTGGLGGESGYARASLGKDSRRPGGGGGGRFAADDSGAGPGLAAQPGLNGHADSRGAVGANQPAPGGLSGPGPFGDNTTSNDFFGTKPVIELDTSGVASLKDLIRGELPRMWAGYGGGGGGDALPSTRFPTPRWNPGSDEKGGGGGGGGGGVRIRALGQIVFGTLGLIDTNGGRGATGENTSFLDHIGGTGGSGSGGHVVLESGVRIDFTNGDPASALNRRHISARGGPRTIGSLARGVPSGISHGGSGGPGVIQLHVPSIQPFSDELDPSSPTHSNIVVPAATLASPSANKLAVITTPPAIHLIPTFGPRSKARSRWIPLGGAAVNPDGSDSLVTFLFGGTDTAPGQNQGEVLSASSRVRELPPLLGPEPLSSSVFILQDEVTLRIQGSSLAPFAGVSDLYLRTPALLNNFVIRLREAGNVENALDFDVSFASYDDAARALDLTIDQTNSTLTEFTSGRSIEVMLVPHFFRVRTEGQRDVLPDSMSVRITFEGARDDGFGRPDESNILVPPTASISDFNALAPGQLRFFRFEVEFDLDANQSGLQPNPRRPELEFLRVPFRF